MRCMAVLEEAAVQRQEQTRLRAARMLPEGGQEVGLALSHHSRNRSGLGTGTVGRLVQQGCQWRAEWEPSRGLYWDKRLELGSDHPPRDRAQALLCTALTQSRRKRTSASLLLGC